MTAQGTKRRWAFGAVSTALIIGHALTIIAAATTGLLIVVEVSPLHRGAHDWNWISMGVLATGLLHLLTMLPGPLWSWLCARTQTRVSRLWAWLGYLIPLAGYVFPARILRQLADGTAPETRRLRTLILAWGVARGLAGPLVVTGIVYLLHQIGPSSNVTFSLAAAYVVLSLIAANLLSILVIGQMRRYLATAIVDERHAEVFA